jgi:hypothetical protein
VMALTVAFGPIAARSRLRTGPVSKGDNKVTSVIIRQD